MVFSSYKFIFLFLPVTAIGYAILKKIKKPNVIKLWLIAASVVFYSWGQISFLPVFLSTLLLNYVFIKIIGSTEKRFTRTLFLVLGILEGLSLLFFYKYFNFTLYTMNRFFGADFLLREIILPLGISFYTFQIMTYLIDVYKKEAPVYPVMDYLLYVTFFPQLIVGPIVRHSQFMPQLETDSVLKSNKERIAKGIVIFSIGCAKKILIADPLITYALSYYGADGGSTLQAWLATLSYTFAYYFDFSGYSDMAVGLGNFFNITLPFNFNSPYKARNMADFWRRWNISVSNFFDDYVFRSIFRFGDRSIKLILATLITFLVSGIWHGAGWNYILWGIANGILVACVNLATLHRIKLPSIIAYPLTGICIVLTRVLFDSRSFTQIKQTFSLMFSLSAETLSQIPQFLSENVETAALILLSCIICWVFKNTREIEKSFKLTPKWAIFSALLIVLSLMNMGKVSNFLYFDF